MDTGNLVYIFGGWAKNNETGEWAIRVGYEVVTRNASYNDVYWAAWWRLARLLSPGEGYSDHRVVIRPVDDFNIIDGYVWGAVIFASNGIDVFVDVCNVNDTDEESAMRAAIAHCKKRFPNYADHDCTLIQVPDMQFVSE